MKRLLIVLSALVLGACSWLGGQLREPEVALAGMRMGQGDGLYQTVLVDLMITNPNASTLKLNAISYRIRIDGRDLINGTSREPLEIDAGATTKYTVPASISLMSGFGFIRDMLTKPKSKVGYELNATLEPGGLFSVPISVKKVDTINLSQ